MLISCGSFNPPTPMHFRMFGEIFSCGSESYFTICFTEIAKDHFTEQGTHEVIGGIVSPVHDAYGKKGLASQSHRLAMLQLALQSSPWIKISEWECQQETWSRTRTTLQHHQNYLNSIISDMNGMNKGNLPSWIPDNVKQLKERVQIKMLCGADLLESFATPDLWDADDVSFKLKSSVESSNNNQNLQLESILGQHGIVVVTRSGSNPEQIIFDSDLLSKYRRNIHIVTNWIANDVSSTLARRFISRGLSVKYLLDDAVIEYINKTSLYKDINSNDFET